MLRSLPRLASSCALLRQLVHSGLRSRSAGGPGGSGCALPCAAAHVLLRPRALRSSCAAAGDGRGEFESTLVGVVPREDGEEEGDGDGGDDVEQEAWVIDTPRGPTTLVQQDGVLLEPALAAALRFPTNVSIKSAEFVKSSVSVADCPPGNHPDFAFIGRSNVGKSSLVNCLTGRKQLALVSNTPGKTQTINHFMVLSSGAGPWYLVDLPGYGYARAPGDLRDAWTDFTMEFFQKRESLVSVLLLIDGTIPPQEVDLEVANWLGEHNIPFSVVFTKVDKRRKVRPGVRTNPEDNVRAFQEALAPSWEQLPPCVITSSVTGFGRQALLNHIAALRKLHIAKHGPIKARRLSPVEKLQQEEDKSAAKAKQTQKGGIRVAPAPPKDAILEGGMPEQPKEEWELDRDDDDVAPPPGMRMPPSTSTSLQANDIVKKAASRVGVVAASPRKPPPPPGRKGR